MVLRVLPETADPAQNAQLNDPIGLCVDAAGNLYIGDYGNQRIRKISKATGIITTIAGTGAIGIFGRWWSRTERKLQRLLLYVF